MLYRGSKDELTPAAFWQRCEGKANTLTVVKVSRSLLGPARLASSANTECSLAVPLPFCLLAQVKETGNVFAVFTPIAWPTGSPGYIADPSGRTCIVSLVNKHDRSCRLKLKQGHNAYAACKSGYGPSFGSNGYDLRLMHGQSYCFPQSFELDAEAESKAGLPMLPFAYDKALLSGVNVNSCHQQQTFTPSEIECYTLDA